MFGFFKKKQQPAATGPAGQKGEPLMSAVLMKGDCFPFEFYQKALGAVKLAGEKATGVELTDGNILTFNLGDDLAAIALMPAPYPSGDLEGPIQTSWLWPDGTSAEDVRPHRTHLLITLTMGSADPVRRLLRLTAITALAAKQQGVMGVYWPQATMVHSPKAFVELAEGMNTPDAPPLLLWVDYRVFKNTDGTTGMFTTGLTELGHMEIEISKIDMEPGDLREWAVNITQYLLVNGPVLLDGQTLGMTADHKIRISHRPSQFGKNATVIRLIP